MTAAAAANTKAPKMAYSRLGNSELQVSRICMGTICLGKSTSSFEKAFHLVKAAYDAGINFFDTSNSYANGESEVVLGKALKSINAPRDRFIVSTKFHGLVDDSDGLERDVNNIEKDDSITARYGTSRKHIFDAVEASLKRLDVDYIDVYQVDRLDGVTPLEETMEALNDLVCSGKVRYIGASLIKVDEFRKMNHIAEKNGWSQFIGIQNRYNLISREDERELIPYCLSAGIGAVTNSPLASGVLTGKNRNIKEDNSRDKIICNRVDELAKKHNVSMGQVALAWVLSKPFVASTVVGIADVNVLTEVINTLLLELSEGDIHYIEEAYTDRHENL